MSEEFTEEHKKLYQYAGNSNLVLPSDRSKINRRGDRGKEMESLWGKIDGNQMGSNVRREQPPKSGAGTGTGTAASKTTHANKPKKPKKSVLGGYRDIVSATEEEEGVYKPRSRETQVVWDMLLACCRRHIGDQTPEVLVSAADEALSVLKDESSRDREKRAEVEKLFGAKVDEAEFSRFIQLASQITDYEAGGSAVVEEDDQTGDIDESGIAVEFGDDSDEGAEDDDDDEDEEHSAAEEELKRMDVDQHSQEDEDEGRVVLGDTAQPKHSAEELEARSIDAFWLQRLVAQHYADPAVVQEKTREAQALLEDSSKKVGELENALAEVFDYEHFAAVQLLVTNRDMVVWCMRLARAGAEGTEQRRAVEAQMREAGAHRLLGETKGAEAPRKAAAAVEAEAERVAEVDLDSLAFAQGAHLMTNDRWVPPPGAAKTVMPGYEEIHVPAPEPLGAADAHSPLVSVAELPEWARAALPGVQQLNRVQSRVFATAFTTDDNMLICAPTGAGKTNCAALAMLRTIGQFRDGAGNIDAAAFKIVYVAPMKALVAEMAGAFKARLEPLGLRVAELTGDSQLTKAQIAETQLLVTTPEKWDVVTRKGHEGSYTQLVRLVIIDEIHLLHDERGPVLESLAVRLKRAANGPRLVGLSATLPNADDVATFLRVPARALFRFDARYRPCPLQMQFVGLTDTKHVRRRQRMDEVCYAKAQRAAQAGGQVLVFVHSRKETVRTAQALRDMAVDAAALDAFVRGASASAEVLREEAAATRDAQLAALLPFGVAVHHAGMARADRALAEDLFADGHVRVLVSTATLAWGVNLPAHTVIIKGTQVYSPQRGAWAELSPQDVLQMLGRAGRPQFDTFGEGVIITAHSELRYYLSLMSHQLPIESQMVARLPDMLNAEVVLGSVRSRDDAAAWLAQTYLFVRMLRSPAVYGLSADAADEDPALSGRRQALAHAAALALERCGMVRYDRRGGRLAPTELGRVASHYYVTHRTMAAFQQHLRSGAGDIDLLAVFARADEFRLIPVRAEERVELQRLLERVPVPVRGDTDDGPMPKVAALLQAHVARLALPGFALAADAVYVTQSAARLFRALFELSRARGWARAARCALGWCKQVERRMWLAMSPLRQFGRDCPADLLRSVERRPLPWARYLDLTEPELGELVGSPKAGRVLHRLVHLVPRLDVRAHVQPLTRSLLRFELRLTPDFVWNDAVHGSAEVFWVTVEDADGERLLHAEPLVIKRAYAAAEHLLEFTCALTEPLPPQYFVAIDSDRWIGADTRLAVSFRHLQLPDRALPPTELLDMQPLPVSELRDPEFEALYRGKLSEFNAVQTQCFHALYRTDDSALLAAAPGAGKTLAAEIALLRFFRQEAERAQLEGDSYVRRRALYIAPFATLVEQRTRAWQRRFASVQGGKSVVCLTGDAVADLRLLDDAHVALATPAQWDALSRRWRQRQRQCVRDIGLVIVDELHWIGGSGLGTSSDEDLLASLYEVVVSRVRYMAAQLDRHIRVVGLTVPLANARDVAAWIGAPASAVFNFAPSVRPSSPLEIRVVTSGIAHFASRMDAWVAPAYRAISRATIVFVPARKQCRSVSTALVDMALGDEAGSRFGTGDAMAVSVAVDDLVLGDLLPHGAAYYHEALSESDKAAVLAQFASGAVQVLVASRESCWALDHVHAPTVVIMGAEKYCGREHRYVDYSVPEVLQMMGRASTLALHEQALCLLMCMAGKRDFYLKFLHEPLPLESRLDGHLHDAMNSEVVAKTIASKQDAVDYLTWTLLYRRLVQNPNYYGLQGTSHEHLSDYLSELIESTLADLEAAKCVSMDEDAVEPTNLGMIAAYYQIRYLTVEMFALSLSAKTKLRGVLDIISAADEFEALPVRHREEAVLDRIALRLPVPLPSSSTAEAEGMGRWNSPRVRTHLLLQAHFSRLALPADLAADQQWCLLRVMPLLQALVDVASSMGWLAPALAAMELSQMSVQAIWESRDPLVKQVPHLSERLDKCTLAGVQSVFDIMDMEDDDRARLLNGLAPRQVAEVAAFVNRYPNIEVDYQVDAPKDICEGGLVSVRLSLNREWDDDEEVGPVIAPFFPSVRMENWWVVIGDPQNQALVAVKRLGMFSKHLDVQVEFNAPERVGTVKWKMFLMCDAFLGCDQEFDLEMDVQPAEDDDEEEEDEDDEDL